jgi:hypothetical protein
MANLQKLMEQMHTELAKELLARIQSGEANPADLKTALSFLKEHGITKEVKPGDQMVLLADAFDVDALPFDKTGTE